jgi:stringent starvation protein B
MTMKIVTRENGKTREFESNEAYQKYLEAKNPKPKKTRKKKEVINYEAIEQVGKDEESE